MKIVNKVTGTLLLVSVLPCILITAVYSRVAYDGLRDSYLQKLEALANLQANRIQGILDTYTALLSLVTSRTQLRLSLARYNQTGGKEGLPKIMKIYQ